MRCTCRWCDAPYCCPHWQVLWTTKPTRGREKHERQPHFIAARAVQDVWTTKPTKGAKNTKGNHAISRLLALTEANVSSLSCLSWSRGHAPGRAGARRPGRRAVVGRYTNFSNSSRLSSSGFARNRFTVLGQAGTIRPNGIGCHLSCFFESTPLRIAAGQSRDRDQVFAFGLPIDNDGELEISHNPTLPADVCCLYYITVQGDRQVCCTIPRFVKA